MPFAPSDHWIFQLKEIHRSGASPDTWVCGWCGCKLKGEPHNLGISTGVRYCNRCMDRGKEKKDLKPLPEEEVVRRAIFR